MEAREGEIRRRLARIVAEMQAAGMWEVPAPSEADLDGMGAFGQGTLAFEQWLRWVFVPTVEDRLASGGPWPSVSMVGAQAVREFDGRHEAAGVCEALSEFDTLF